MIKRAAKRLSYLAATILLLALLLIAYSQTPLFKEQMRSLIISRLDSLIEADVYLGPIEGNLLTAFSIDSVSVMTHGEPILIVSRVEAEYDPFALWRNTIQVDRIALINPDVRLSADSRGRWNFATMVRPTPEDSAAGGPFTLNALLTSLVIKNGSVRITDTAALASPDHGPVNRDFVEYHDVHLTNLDLDLSGGLQGDDRQIIINNLSFRADGPDFELRRLAGKFKVGKNNVGVEDFVLLTGKSSIELDASMRGIDLLGGIELSRLRDSPTELTVRNSDVNLEELSRFIPDIDFLSETVSLDLEVQGAFGEFDIRRLDLAVGQTSFHVLGSMYNLHRPGDLYLDVRFIESTIFSPDAHAVLPTFHLPDYEHLGVADFSLAFKGKPLDFRTEISMQTSGGNARAEVNLAIGGAPTLTYRAHASFDELDVEALLSGGPESQLKGELDLAGEGIDFRTLRSTLAVHIDSSVILGNSLKSASIKAKAEGGSLDADVDTEIGSTHAAFTLGLDHLTDELPSFAFRGDVASLNIGELIRDTTLDSRITARFDARGKGLGAENISGDIQMDILSSRLRNLQLDSARVHVLADQTNRENRHFLVESDIADISLDGAFDLPYLIDLLRFESSNIAAALDSRLSLRDTLGESRLRQHIALNSDFQSLAERNIRLDAAFELKVKDLEPISMLTGDRAFNGVGTLTGRLVGDVSNLSVEATLNAHELFYGTAESGFYLAGGVVSLAADRLLPISDPFTKAGIRLEANAPDFHLNKIQFDNLLAFFELKNGSMQYRTTGRYGDGIEFSLGGTGSISSESIVLVPEESQVRLGTEVWILEDGSSFSIGGQGIELENVVFHSDTQKVRIDGSIGKAGKLEGSLRIEKLGLDILETMLSREEGSERDNLIGGTGSLAVVMAGTIDQPDIHGLVEAHDVSFKDFPFGELRVEAVLRDGVVSIDGVVADDISDHSLRPKLRVHGVLPVSDSRTDADLAIQSDGIQINFLDPLLPTFKDLNGILRCDLTVNGPVDNLSYGGSFSISDCRFLFVPNNIQYHFSGRFEPVEGDRIRVLEAVARNIPSDNRPGRQGQVAFSGSFDLADFVPTDFDLVARGELLVVKPESRRSSLPLYGDLYIETGSSGLHFTGTIEKSLLRGVVLVRSSRLIFPAREGARLRESDYSIPVIVVDDTSVTKDNLRESFREVYFNRISSITSVGPERQMKKSFLEGIEYDLTVETSGPSSEIKLIFSELPVEELQANFRGKWTITGDGTRWIGDLAIERAYYSFFKQFDATGRLRYTGELLNPELDITASYQSTRTIQVQVDSTSKTERVVVILRITGTRTEPRHEMSMTIDDIDYYSYTGPKSTDLESDAITFILAGTFPLSRSESNVIAADLQTSVGASMVVGASSVLTKELSDYLRRETGFITSVEFGYGSQSSFREAADIRLSGTAFKGYWRYRGTILDNPLNNSDVSLLYSFGEIFDKPSLRNFMFELERSAESETIGLIDETKEVNSARLFYRFSF